MPSMAFFEMERLAPRGHLGLFDLPFNRLVRVSSMRLYRTVPGAVGRRSRAGDERMPRPTHVVP